MADLTAEKAYELAQQLTSIDGCSRLEVAIEATAEDLMEICRTLEEAEGLAREARFTWKKWHGTAGLIELLQIRRGPSSSVWPPAPPTLGPKPPVECPSCNDFGTVYRNGLEEWCTCRQAQILQAESPNLLDRAACGIDLALLQHVPIDQKNITEADIERAFREHQDRTEQVLRDARVTLDNAEATRDQREIARDILRCFGAEGKAG